MTLPLWFPATTAQEAPLSNALLRKIGLWLLLWAAPTVAHAQFSVLYNFGSNAGDPTNPTYPTAIAQGRDGDLYSTGQGGGANGDGAVFKITPSGTLTVIYSFCSQPSCADGTDPRGGLVLGTDGNFYGTTNGGGTTYNAYGGGVVFKITPAGALTVLHAFNSTTDGGNPWSPPVEGPDGNFYGTTNSGGNGSGCGTIYKVTPSGTFTVLHTFASASTDGCSPRSALVPGVDGYLYGTASYGAVTEFKISTSGKYVRLNGTLSTYGPLVQAGNGFFYGGANNHIFKMSASGAASVLYTLNGTTDGNGLNSGVVWAFDGNFYGVTFSGGTMTNCSSNLGSCGVIFKITPSGAYTVLHDFENPDGYEPGVIFQHTNGILYGNTTFGGTVNGALGCCGTFYRLNNSLKPFIRLLPATGKVGDQIGILGQGFSPSSVVKFNGVTATSITVTGSTFISATVPVGTLDGYVTVTTGGTTLTSQVKFLVHDSWGTGAPMPTAVVYPAAGFISGKIYVVGGNTLSTGAGTANIIGNNQAYNTSTNTWTSKAPIPTPVWAASSAVVNGILYVIGGYTSSGATDSLQAYHPTTNTWTTEANMPAALGETAAVVDNGVIYVMGGGVVNGSRANNVEKYNPATNTWTVLAPLLQGKSEPSAGLLGKTIVGADGFTNSGDTGDNEGYNVSTNVWSSLKPDPSPRHASCFGVISGELYIAGGYDANVSPNAISMTESFNLTSWATLSSMLKATSFPASAVGNGMVYCFGGEDSFSGNVLHNVQIYQP